MQFARVINRYDFIDSVIRHADPSRFDMMACSLAASSTIEPPDYPAAGIPHWVLRADTRRSYPATVLRLAKLLRREKVDILHTHHFDEALIGVMAATLSTRTRVVVGRHYHDEVYLLTAGVKRRAMLQIEAFCYRRAVALTTPSPRIKQLLVERQRIPAAKIFPIPLPFDFSAPRYRRVDEQDVRRLRGELGLGDGFVIGNFGRHHELKGQSYLLRAFAELVRDCPHLKLLMVGDGPSHQALRALTTDLGLASSVVFAGWRPDAARLIAVVDAVAHPSLHEAFSQLMVEALVHGKPLVITSVAGPVDYMENGRTAILIPPMDLDALQTALRWILEHPADARRMAEQGCDYVRREFCLEKIVPRYEACYEAVMKDHR